MSETRARGQAGFTLVELLTAFMLLTIVVTLTVAALRHYWFVQSLEGGKDEVVTQLRGLQQRVISETFPLVYGARFTPNRSSWQHVQFNPDDGTCDKVQEGDLDGGQFSGDVRIESSSFDTYTSGGTDVSELCREGIDDAEVVFFFARGTATEGEITLVQPRLDRRKTVCISGPTGRVDYEADGTC